MGSGFRDRAFGEEFGGCRQVLGHRYGSGFFEKQFQMKATCLRVPNALMQECTSNCTRIPHMI